MNLPNDVHRCRGDRNYRDDLRSPCDTCLRALSPPPERIWYVCFINPPIVNGECDYWMEGAPATERRKQ